MIISKKRFNEKIREAIEKAEMARVLHGRVDKAERRLDAIEKRCAELEARLKKIKEVK
jgi:polyhydroxyalkanoate synthesis regulator phasin